MTSVSRRYYVGARRALRLGFVSLSAAAVLGCAMPKHDDRATYRDSNTILAATTRFDPVKFSGDWVVTAWLPQAWGTRRLHFDLTSSQMTGEDSVSISEQTDELLALMFLADVPKPGVIDVRYPLGPRDLDARPNRWVVMWVDESFSTAALGRADGRAAYILTRPGKARSDQIAAAREVFDFNGWDVSQLRVKK